MQYNPWLLSFGLCILLSEILVVAGDAIKTTVFHTHSLFKTFFHLGSTWCASRTYIANSCRLHRLGFFVLKMMGHVFSIKI